MDELKELVSLLTSGGVHTYTRGERLEIELARSPGKTINRDNMNVFPLKAGKPFIIIARRTTPHTD